MEEGTESPTAICGPGSVAAHLADLTAELIAAPVGQLLDAELVDLIAELERLKNVSAAVQVSATDLLRTRREQAATTERGRLEAIRSVGSEVALARRESPWWGSCHVGLARVLTAEMPRTRELLQSGVITERHALVLAQQTAALSRRDRAEVDTRLSAVLPALTVRQAEAAAVRVAAELDAASLVSRRAAAVRSRRVTVRPAPDGMAYLSILGPLHDVVGAKVALTRHADRVAAGLDVEDPQGRTAGAIAVDTALALLSGRADGQLQAVEIQLVITDRALLGTGDGERSVMEPARIVGHGTLPAPTAREWIADRRTRVWLRRLYTTPDARSLVAMDSRRRCFSGQLRRMVVLRDDRCVTPWCDAPIVHADHLEPARSGAPTSYGNGGDRCARCNYTKEAPGWIASADQIRTPSGRSYRSESPPLLGWGAVA